MPSDPESVRILLAAGSLFAASLAVVTAWFRLGASARATRLTLTLRACERYTFDPLLHECTARIFAVSKGKNYKSLGKKHHHDILTVLNYFDALALGIRQGV